MKRGTYSNEFHKDPWLSPPVQCEIKNLQYFLTWSSWIKRSLITGFWNEFYSIENLNKNKCSTLTRCCLRVEHGRNGSVKAQGPLASDHLLISWISPSYIVVLFWWRHKMGSVSWKKIPARNRLRFSIDQL